MDEVTTEPLRARDVDTADTAASGRSFAELMDALRGGCDEAASTIAELYTSHLLRAVRASLPREIRSKIDSVDIVNTLWGSLLTKRWRLEGIREPAQLVALLKQAARNRVIDEHRRYTAYEARDLRREAGSLDAPSPTGDRTARRFAVSGNDDTPSQIASIRERWALFVVALSDRDRKIVSLRMSGKSYDEIADAVEGVSSRTARRVVADAVTRLSQ
ncbi:MAG: RNA polymerase sigma factor [Lacipirellulaceae bacterium]